ncbi:head-tail connector protein [Neobacillus mesonae]|uniref:head-tail connector protein n=1 Tax=Neobacillus mesonae TaxID=1193713 RepID=UPI002E1A6412|nr:head-tail connector protein [Neobacillus mesonae]
MIVSVEEANNWLRDIPEEDTAILKVIVDAAELYLKNATSKTFDDTNPQAKLFCLVLIADWYENRELIAEKPSEKKRLSLESMLAQLTYCGDEV